MIIEIRKTIGPLHGLPIAIKDIFGTNGYANWMWTPLENWQHTPKMIAK